MADLYVGDCSKHGRFVESCDACQREQYDAEKAERERVLGLDGALAAATAETAKLRAEIERMRGHLKAIRVLTKSGSEEWLAADAALAETEGAT